MTAAPQSSAADLPVRPGEDPWSDAELADLRIELEKEAAGLRAELGDAETQLNARLGSSAAEAGDDEADTSSKLFEREHELALNNNMRELLEQTEHALNRIDAGTYGVCEIVRQADREGAAAGIPAGDPVRGLQAAPGAPLSPAAGSPAGPAPVPPRAASRRRVAVLAGIAAFVLAADAITKSIVVAHLRPDQPVHVLGTLVMLWLTRNPGAAFSVGTGETIVFTVIAFGVIVAIARTARNLRSLGWAIALGLLLGGATGNLADRILRAPGLFRGYVVDWIAVTTWYPIFNLADSAIVGGGILTVILAMRGHRLDGTRADPAAAAPAPAATTDAER